jgi:hypothetical protein
LENIMKKYLTIAAVLGVIAFASVSFLAQADQQPANNVMAKQKAAPDAEATDPSDGEAEADKAAADSDAAASTEMPAAEVKFTADDSNCATEADASDKDGNPPTDVQKNTAYRKCMQMKGHSAAEMKKHGVDLSNTADAHDQGTPAEE